MSRFVSLLFATLAGIAAAAADTALLRTFKVGGEGGWDYVSLDPEAGRIDVPRSTRVTVLVLVGKVVGEVPGTRPSKVPGSFRILEVGEKDR